MMGLFDWLSEAIGGGGSMLPPEQTTNGLRPTPAQTFQRPEFASPPPAPMPQAPDPSQGQQPPMMPPPPPPGAPMGPDSPQNPTGGPVPMPMARPPGADVPPPAPPSPPPMNIPPPAAAGGGAGAGAVLPPGATPADGAMPGPGPSPGDSGPEPQGRGFLARALGLDPNTEKKLSSGLAAGLKAAGNSSGKSPFQALASGAGATLEGGDKADEKTTDDQRKWLTQAIEAAKIGDTRQLNLARTKLLEAQTKMTLEGKGGKDSVVNSNQQLYLRAQGATNQDANLKILKSQYDKIAMERGASSPEAKAAMDAYQKTYDDTLNSHLGRLGLDPKDAAKIGKQPGMTQENPVDKGKLTSQEAFDKLPPGSWFVNPKDGKVLQKPMQPIKPGAPAAAPQGGQNLPAGQGGTPAAQPASNLPPLPPSTPTASAIPGIGADEDADEKEPA